MKKYLYDRMVAEYSKESKEVLIQRIMALEEIEVSDRCAANQAFAGTSVADINQLFRVMDDLEIKFTYKKAAELIEAYEKAKPSWEYIRSILETMNDDGRTSKVLEDFKKRVASAKDPDDSI